MVSPKPLLAARAAAATAPSMSERLAQNMAASLPSPPLASSVPAFFSWRGSDGVGGLGGFTTSGSADAPSGGGADPSGASGGVAAAKEGFWGAPADFSVSDFLRKKNDGSVGSEPDTPEDGNGGRPPSQTFWERITSPASEKI